jgi:hypothetical protein
VRGPSHEDDFEHRKREDKRCLLEQHRHSSCPLPQGPRCQWGPLQADLPLRRGEVATQKAEEGRFPCTIRANDRHHLARLEVERYISQ